MTEDIGELIIILVFLVLFVPMLFTVFTTVTDQIRGDYVEESEHNRIVNNLESEISALESNNSELRSDKQYLDNVVSNYNENRSDLRQERNYYERLSENLSEEKEALEEENAQLEDEVNRTVPIQRVIDYTLQVWNVQVKVVHVFAVSLSITFIVTLSLVEINLIGWEGKISIKEIINKIRENLNRVFDIINEKWHQIMKTLEKDSG